MKSVIVQIRTPHSSMLSPTINFFVSPTKRMKLDLSPLWTPTLSAFNRISFAVAPRVIFSSTSDYEQDEEIEIEKKNFVKK